MRRSPLSLRWFPRLPILCAASVALLVAGCDGVIVPPPGQDEVEPNDTFATAKSAGLEETTQVVIAGSISQTGDLDVFDLGPLSEGDRIIIDAATPASTLDVAVALFDSQQRLVANNDDRLVTNFDSLLDFTSRHTGDPYFLVVGHSAFALDGTFTGDYQVEITVVRGAEVPAPVGQTLMLDFEGGLVDSPTNGPTFLDAFSARAISRVYTGQTEVLKELIRAAVEQNFARFNVTVLSSDFPPPPGTDFSTVFIGGFDAMLFGEAEGVDLYNVDFCDDAIIYSESFSPGVFTFTPTVEELGVAIGNIIAHEAGHLLGLNHVADDRALMDDRSAADAFIADQEFMEAQLSPDIFPIGTQDSTLLLLETVGPRP